MKQVLLYVDAISNRTAPIGFAILVILFLCCGCWPYWQRAFPQLPSDAELIRNYQDHKAEFQQLVQMVQAENEFEAIAPRDTYGNGGCQLIQHSGSVGIV